MKINLKATVDSFDISNKELRVLKDFEESVNAVCDRLTCESCPFNDTPICEMRNLTEALADFGVYYRRGEGEEI